MLEVKGHIPHFQKPEKRGCRTMILLLPLFWKTLRKSWMVSMEGNNYYKSKKKGHVWSQMTFCSLFFVPFERLTPTFRLLLRLVLHFPSYLWAYPHHFPVHLQWFASPNFPLTEVAPPCTSRSSQKDCPSLYHPLVRLCFNKIVRRNILFFVISHSLCNRIVILFAVICISHS